MESESFVSRASGLVGVFPALERTDPRFADAPQAAGTRFTVLHSSAPDLSLSHNQRCPMLLYS